MLKKTVPFDMRKTALPIVLSLALSVGLFAQQQPSRLSAGINLFGEGKWREAVVELRRASAEAAGPGEAAEALYWIALAELSAGEHEAALADLDELLRLDPKGPRSIEAAYQKGRALFYLGRYDGAVAIFKAYADTVADGGKKAAALYWMGECLFALGRMEDARAAFSVVVDRYPGSAKFEASSYRIALIDQKKIEAELLKLLKWSHEESLRTVEEYQRRERSYEQAIVAYQKRIAEMLKDTRLADLERSNADLATRLAQAEAGLAAAELALAAARALPPVAAPAAAPEPAAPRAPSATDSERLRRLLALKSAALDLREQLITRLGTEAGK